MGERGRRRSEPGTQAKGRDGRGTSQCKDRRGQVITRPPSTILGNASRSAAGWCQGSKNRLGGRKRKKETKSTHRKEKKRKEKKRKETSLFLVWIESNEPNNKINVCVVTIIKFVGVLSNKGG